MIETHAPGDAEKVKNDAAAEQTRIWRLLVGRARGWCCAVSHIIAHHLDAALR
jgi:hypothetical protein